MCGLSKLYLAPEIQRDPDSASNKGDVYSLGVILYMLIATDLQEDVFVSKKSLMSNEPHKAIFDFSEP